MAHITKPLGLLPVTLIKPGVCAALLSVLFLLSGLAADAAHARPGSAQSQHTYDQLVEQGRQAEARGKPDEAITRYQDALKIKTDSALPQTRLAAIYYSRNDFDKALEYSNRVLAVNPRDPAAAKIAGMAAYQMNRFDQAAKYLRTALAARSNDPQTHYWLGMSLYASRDARQALDEFYRARLYDPKDVEALYMLGKIHWEMCRQAWEEMVKVDPDSVRVKQMVAEQDDERNLYEQAIAKYKEIIEQQPETPGVHYALGKLYVHIKRFAEAENAFQAELKLNSHNPLAYYGLAEVAFQQQDLPVALENANRAIKENPDYGDAYVLLGRIEVNMGDKTKAEQDLERAASLSPSDPSPFYMLAHIYTDLGKTDLAAKAIATYQQLQDEQEKERRVAR